MNSMTKLVGSYIDWKHTRGFKIEVEGKTLLRFAEYADKAGWDGGVGVEIVDRWIESFDSPSDWYKARLYETVRTFSGYAAAADLRSVTLPRGRGNCHGRTEPYIYSGDEMCIMMDELHKAYSPDGLRNVSLVCMVGLMWCTGMRPKEVIELGVSDYRQSDDTIVVRASKFRRTRLVPLSDDCASYVEEYLSARLQKGRCFSGLAE